MTLTLIQDHSCLRNRKLRYTIFLQIFILIWMKFISCHSLLKLMLNLVCTSNIQGRELCFLWTILLTLSCFRTHVNWFVSNILSEISVSVWMKFSMVWQHVDLLKFILNLVFTVKIQRRESTADGTFSCSTLSLHLTLYIYIYIYIYIKYIYIYIYVHTHTHTHTHTYWILVLQTW